MHYLLSYFKISQIKQALTPERYCISAGSFTATSLGLCDSLAFSCNMMIKKDNYE